MSNTNRRGFFRGIFGEVKQGLLSAASGFLKEKFKRDFLRPPGAIAEEEFLFACSRCDKCVEACPYDVIHLIDDIMTPALRKTPFIDPFHKACQFCSDAPCVKACPDGALKLDPKGELPKMGVAVVNSEHCLAQQGQRCDYCFKSCPQGIDAIKPGKNGAPIIDIDTCVGCGKCAYICVSQSGKALVIVPE